MHCHLHWKRLKLGSSPESLNQSGGRLYLNSFPTFFEFKCKTRNSTSTSGFIVLG